MPTATTEQALIIEWCGPSDKDAEDLAFALAGAGSIDVHEAPNARATMAAGEIVLTILASAATQAVIHVAVDKLHEYLKEKISANQTERKKAPDLKVVVKGKDRKPVERLVSLRLATVDFVAEFVDKLGDEIAKAIS